MQAPAGTYGGNLDQVPERGFTGMTNVTNQVQSRHDKESTWPTPRTLKSFKGYLPNRRYKRCS